VRIRRPTSFKCLQVERPSHKIYFEFTMKIASHKIYYKDIHQEDALHQICFVTSLYMTFMYAGNCKSLPCV
jgi:hypothetical protein